MKVMVLNASAGLLLEWRFRAPAWMSQLAELAA
jgi:hypothetical protein